MTSKLILAISWASWIFRFFRRLGALGLFLLGILDSSFLVLPFGNDVLLIALVSANRNGWSWIGYVLMSALGSVVGVLIIDVMMRKAGEEGLKRFVTPKRITRLRKEVESRTNWAILTATILPPPFPFTPVIMVASAFQCSRRNLLLLVFVGRMVRFGLEALLALYFGRRILSYLNSTVVEYLVYAVIAVAIVASTLSLLKWIRRPA